MFQFQSYKTANIQQCLWLEEGNDVNRSTQIRRTACQNVQPLSSTRLGKKAILLLRNLHIQPYTRWPQGGRSLLSPSSPSRKSTFPGPLQKNNQINSSEHHFVWSKSKTSTAPLATPGVLGLAQSRPSYFGF